MISQRSESSRDASARSLIPQGDWSRVAPRMKCFAPPKILEIPELEAARDPDGQVVVIVGTSSGDLRAPRRTREASGAAGTTSQYHGDQLLGDAYIPTSRWSQRSSISRERRSETRYLVTDPLLAPDRG